MALPPHASPIERAWYYTYRGICALIFLFLIAPIIVIIPLSFNSEPYFTYPMAGYSLRWYEVIFGDNPQSVLWQRSMVNSVIVAVFATILATALGTIADWRRERPHDRVGGSVADPGRGQRYCRVPGHLVRSSPAHP